MEKNKYLDQFCNLHFLAKNRVSLPFSALLQASNLVHFNGIYSQKAHIGHGWCSGKWAAFSLSSYLKWAEKCPLQQAQRDFKWPHVCVCRARSRNFSYWGLGIIKGFK